LQNIAQFLQLSMLNYPGKMVQFINTLSLTPTVNDWLVNSRHPRILHVFDQVCNLLNEHRDVLLIVTQQIGNGPFNLVVEKDILFSNHLNIESLIFIRADQLQLGDLIINTANAEPWSPRPNWKMLHAKREDIKNQLIALPVTNYELPMPAQLLSTFSASIATVDLSSSLIATRKLAGLGIGLTPSGDDFILGAIYAAWIIHPFETARLLAEEITNIAAPLTTSLSAAWLRSAGRGEAGILWHQFFEALISHDPIQIKKTTDKILTIGETSGADALAGFIGSFVAWYKVDH